MKVLKDILYNIKIISIQGDVKTPINQLTFDSRKANSKSLFFAIQGTNIDGHDYIQDALDLGCKSIVVDKEISIKGINLIIVENTKIALALAANNFYNEPSKELKLIGITGTNGKTTIATLLFNLYNLMGFQTGLISTIVNKIGLNELPSTHTTPDPISLNILLRRMVDEGISHCFMEVSSHAIHQNRITGISFSGGVFTNITHDHLDYHKTFKEYINVKKSFFDKLPKTAFALTNIDDKNGEIMLQNTQAKKISYSLKSISKYHAKILENDFSGLLMSINKQEIWTKLIGDFNAYNLLAVFGVSQELGEDERDVLTTLSQLKSISGRFQFFKSKTGIISIIDYAHTPDALKNVLKTIENIRTKNESVYTIIGCGGNRDKRKRPEMAKIACNLSDKVIFTSDNPRTENPEEIIEDMMIGVDAVHYKKTLKIVDRTEAIKIAVSMAKKNDIILIAGKGHENYQEIKGVKHPFDDVQKILEILNKFNK